MLSHIVMHLTLCRAAARLGPQAELPVHVTVTDKINRDVVDQTFHISRFEGDTSPVEFDVPWGIYTMAVTVQVGHTTCGATDYFGVLADHNRTLDLTVNEHPVREPVPTLIMGTLPFAFSYVNPTLVVFGRGVKCKGPIGTPLDIRDDIQNDADGYYITLFPSPALAQNRPLLFTMQLKDSQGGYHYVRFPVSEGMGSINQLSITENTIDGLAGQPEDTILCPRVFETTTH